MIRTTHVDDGWSFHRRAAFYALAESVNDTGGLTVVHELQDIETLNRRALNGELEVTAVSIHACSYIADRFALLPHGASMGEGYGPRVVASDPMQPADLATAWNRGCVSGRFASSPLLLYPEYLARLRPFDCRG